MIGASRILHALAVDRLFGEAANPNSPGGSCARGDCFLKDRYTPHRSATGSSRHYVELGEPVGGGAVHLGSGTGQRARPLQCSVVNVCVFGKRPGRLWVWCLCFSAWCLRDSSMLSRAW